MNCHPCDRNRPSESGRGDWIRTSDPLRPSATSCDYPQLCATSELQVLDSPSDLGLTPVSVGFCRDGASRDGRAAHPADLCIVRWLLAVALQRNLTSRSGSVADVRVEGCCLRIRLSKASMLCT
jgi:hypothetical protein